MLQPCELKNRTKLGKIQDLICSITRKIQDLICSNTEKTGFQSNLPPDLKDFPTHLPNLLSKMFDDQKKKKVTEFFGSKHLVLLSFSFFYRIITAGGP